MLFNFQSRTTITPLSNFITKPESSRVSKSVSLHPAALTILFGDETKPSWIPAICKALNCDTGYLFGEHEEKTYLECDIHEKTGLSENSILSLRAIMEMESPIKEAVSYFLDDLLAGLHILTLSVRYKEYRENTHSESDSYYVTDSTGKPIDMIDDNISILLLQNEFNRFIFEENDPEKRFFSRSSLRKEYASMTVEERLDHLLEHQSDLERGK